MPQANALSIIPPAARTFPNISNALSCEHYAQNKFFAAIRTMREAIQLVNDYSSAQQIDPIPFENFVDDEWPTEAQWDARIAEGVIQHPAVTP